jgi:hypothetical protein
MSVLLRKGQIPAKIARNVYLFEIFVSEIAKVSLQKRLGRIFHASLEPFSTRFDCSLNGPEKALHDLTSDVCYPGSPSSSSSFARLSPIL